MAMKLKTDDKGAVVLQEGKPVYIDETDGKELVFDADQMYGKIKGLNKESADHRIAAKGFEDKLKLFGERTPEDITKAFSLLESVGGPDGITELQKKGKIDIEGLKKTMEEGYNLKVKGLQTSYDTTVSEKDKALAAKDAAIYNLMVSGQFQTSKYIDENLILTPDIAESAFGKHFKVEDGKVVAYLGEHVIHSREKPGENASFDEALAVIVDKYPMKERILKGTKGSGSGSQQNQGKNKNGSKIMKRSAFDQMSPLEQRDFSLNGGQLED